MYLQIAAIFCLAIVHSSVCNDDVHKLMTANQIGVIFQTSANSVPTHELVAFDFYPSPAFSRVNGQRIVRGPMWLTTPYSDINLWIHPRYSSLIEENTPVYHAKYSPNRPEDVEFVQQYGAMERIGQLYEDPEHWASLMIGQDASGKTRVNGHIASRGLTIRSLPDDIVKQYLRTRRSIDESEYNSSNLSYHVVFSTPETFEKEHSLYAFKQNLRERIDRSVSNEIPYQLTPEILAVVENKLYSDQGNDTDRTLEYLVAFWNGVDLKFRNLENPQINLHISAIIIGTDPRSTPFIWENRIRDGIFEGGSALVNSSTFFYIIKYKFPLNSYDIAVTITTQHLGQSNNGQRVVGKAFSGSVCTSYGPKMISTAIVHDNGAFSGLTIAAHELGHVFGMHHDDIKWMDCKATDGYIMSDTVRYTRNSSSFSTCSINTFQERLHNQEFTCLYNRPNITNYSLPRIMPGKMKSLNEQCAAYGYAEACEIDETDICANIRCRYKQGNCWVLRFPGLEGTPCGSLPNMYCLRGRCTQIPDYSPEALRFLFEGAGWIDRGKSRNNISKTN